MKTVIKASRADDIRKAQAEWEAEDDRRAAIRKKEETAYKKAKAAVYAPVDYKLDMELRKFNLLQFDIRVSQSSRYSKKLNGFRGLEVKVDCNQNKHFDKDSALSWDWSATINDEGEVVKDSGSWSGLQATTEAQMASLKQSVAALEFLNSLDWKELLDVETPDYGKYFTEESRPQRDKPNFTKQLKEAELEEYIGQDAMLLGYSMPEYESRWNQSVKTWFIILSETPKQYKVGEIECYHAKQLFDQGKSINEIVEYAKRYPRRYRKDRIFDTLNYPFIELNEETIEQSRR